jgi:hypothetical protein
MPSKSLPTRFAAFNSPEQPEAGLCVHHQNCQRLFDAGDAPDQEASRHERFEHPTLGLELIIRAERAGADVARRLGRVAVVGPILALDAGNNFDPAR